MIASFFDLLGIARSLADRASPAAALWPNAVASLTSGNNASNDALTIVGKLQAGTSFTNIRPGVDAEGPAVGRLPGTSLWTAFGHYRNGILLAPETARRITASYSSQSYSSQ